MRSIILSIFFISLITSCSQNKRAGFEMPEIGETNRNDRLNNSLAVLNKVLEENIGTPDIYFRRAKVAFELAQFNDALLDITSAIRLEPNIADYSFLKSRILLALDKPSEALIEAEHAATEVESPIFNTYLANLYLELDSLNLAKNYLDQALLMAPKWIEALQLKAKIFTQTDVTPEALSILSNTLRLDSANVDTYDLIAKAYLKEGKLDSAVRFTERGFKYDTGKHLGLWYNRGKIMERLGRGDSAIRVYNKILLLAPEDKTINADIAEIHLRRGNFTVANRFFQKALTAMPKEKSIYIRGGYSLERAFRFKEAQELYLKAKNRFPEDEDFSAAFDKMTRKLAQQYSSGL